jgi:hypothetical protein
MLRMRKLESSVISALVTNDQCLARNYAVRIAWDHGADAD